MENLDYYKAALKRGQDERKEVNQLQDDVLVLFLHHVLRIDNVDTLRKMKNQLTKGIK